MDAPETDNSTPAATPAPAATPPGGADGDISGGAASWHNAAQSAATPPQTQSDTMGQQQISPEAAPIEKPPVVITPVKRGGILGVMDSIGDALSGKTRPELGTDQEGNKYVKETTLSHGQQWARIGARLAAGAAAGMAAGRGAGNMGKAAEAGVESGEKFAQGDKQNRQDLTQEARQQNLDMANHQMQQMQLAEHAWNATRMQVKATQEDVDWESKQRDQLDAGGAVELGTTAHAGDINHIMAKHPDLMKSLVGYKGAEQDLKFVPHYEDGKSAGFTVYRVPAGYNTEVIPDGGVFHTFDPLHPDTLQEHKVSGPISRKELDGYDMSAYSARQKYLNDQQELAAKKAQTAESTAKAGEAPSEIQKNQGEANKANAEAAKARSETGTAVPPGAAPGASSATVLAQYPAPVQTAVQGLLSYQTDPATFPQRKFAKSGQMDRETAVGLAQQIDPSYDEKEFKTRSALQKDVKEGTFSQNIVSLNTAINHLDRLATSGAAMHNTGVQPWNAVKNTIGPIFGATAPGVYKNDINAVANEMSTLFKKTAGTDQEISSWKDTMSKAQTPEQIRAGINEMLQLMQGRYGALEQKYQTGMGRPRDFSMLTPQSRDILTKLGATEFVKNDQGAVPQVQPQAGTAFSRAAFLHANPKGDVNAAAAAAAKDGHPVVD